MRKSKKRLSLNKSHLASHALHWALISGFLLLSVYLLQAYGPFLQASLISLPHHAPYDGVTMPIKKAPNWVILTNDERNSTYAILSQEKLLDIPAYDPMHFLVPFEQLKWGTDSDNRIRNEKITYAVPYLSSYTSDDGEATGSHPAVDIKVPEGTPVFAIANGVVSKVSMSSSGFGAHIVIRHDDFPSFNDPNTKTVYLSSYSHLSNIFITEGTVVTKGQQIALSGSTGTSTTPHLHFQIDKETAPFHPYWPFTSKEAQDAGLDFFSAVNYGLGQQNVTAYTINPLMYVQKYQYQGSLVAEVETPQIVPQSTQETVVINEEVVIPEEHPAPLEATPVATEPTPAETATPVETITPVEIVTTPVVTPVEPQQPAGEVSLFKDVALTDPDYKAFKYLYNKMVLKGYEDSTLQPNRPMLRAEAVKMILAGIGYDIAEDDQAKSLFSDLTNGGWYIPYISAAYKEGFVKGRPDGTFHPTDQVNLVEFYKMLFVAMGLDLNPTITEELPLGVDKTAWYASYVQEALRKNIIDYTPGATLNVSKSMTRREIARAMYKISIMMEMGASRYSKELEF